MRLASNFLRFHCFAYFDQACQVETDAGTISAYIVFLSQHTSDLQLQELDELVLVSKCCITLRVRWLCNPKANVKRSAKHDWINLCPHFS